jgi:hypothetical protein
MWAFVTDVAHVVYTVFAAVFLYVIGAGFETQRIVILRETPFEIVAVSPSEAAAIQARRVLQERFKPVRITLPGWSRFTRLHYDREHAVEFKWF